MSLRKQCFTILICLYAGLVFSQNHVGVNVRLDIAKTWKVNKKLRFELSEKLQVNPEFSRDQQKFGDIFNEINLFPDDDSDGDGLDDGEDNDNDDDDDPTNPSQPLGTLDDRPYAILWEWRSASSFLGSYALTKWLRVEQYYVLNYRKGNDLRHALQTQIRTIQKLGDKFQLTQRIGFQTTSRHNKKTNTTEWEQDYTGRVETEYKFTKKHRWETSAGVNGGFDNGKWEWDRLRLDTNIRYSFTDLQSFDFGYRFQQTLDSKKRVSHSVSLSYMLDF